MVVRFISNMLLLALLAGCFWFLGFLWFLGQLPATTPILSAPEADAIVVLTGGRGRLSHGLKLLDIGKGKQLFISGVHPDSTKDEIFHSEDASLDTTYQRLKDHIIMGRQARDTIGNAYETAEWIRGQSYRSLLLVTNHYHMPRSLLELEHTLPDILITPAPVFSGGFQSRDWWQDTDTVLLLVGEYHKYLASAALHLFAAGQ